MTEINVTNTAPIAESGTSSDQSAGSSTAAVLLESNAVVAEIVAEAKAYEAAADSSPEIDDLLAAAPEHVPAAPQTAADIKADAEIDTMLARVDSGIADRSVPINEALADILGGKPKTQETVASPDYKGALDVFNSVMGAVKAGLDSFNAAYGDPVSIAGSEKPAESKETVGSQGRKARQKVVA